jgi:hypothetical protein
MNVEKEGLNHSQMSLYSRLSSSYSRFLSVCSLPQVYSFLSTGDQYSSSSSSLLVIRALAVGPKKTLAHVSILNLL